MISQIYVAMCKELVPTVRYICGHELADAPRDCVPWNGCGGCGLI